MSRQILITGFGPFLSFGENPSQWLAERSGMPHRILEVSFRGVEEFIESGETTDYTALLHLGVAGGAERFRFETVARNYIGATPDVLNEVHGPAKIDPFGLPQLSSTLWTMPEAAVVTDMTEPSVNAGDYLCNYLLYRSLKSHPEKRVGFLHVPPADKMPLEKQLGVLQDVLQLILKL